MTLDIDNGNDAIEPPHRDVMPPDTEYLGSGLAAIAARLDAILDALIAREQPALSVYNVMDGRNDFPQTVRVRSRLLVLSVSQACQATVRIGSAVDRVFDFGAADTKVLPLQAVIGEGTEMVITVSAGALSTAYVLGYPDL